MKVENNEGTVERKTPVGRRERRGIETREKIFGAALQLFAERGFSATTIDAIAEKSDIGKGTFFNYFENKESILLEYREMQMGRVKAFVTESINSDEPLETLIYNLAVVMTKEQQKSPNMFQSLLTAAFSNENVQKRMTEGLGRSREMLAELIAQRQQCGEIQQDVPPIKIVHSFQRMVFGTTLIWSLSPDISLEQNLKEATEVFVRGILSRK